MTAKTERQLTIGAAGIIGVAALAGSLVGFVLQLVVAYYFGASQQTDAYFMAQSTSEMLSKLLLGGSITAVFLPMFVERIAKGQHEDAWHLGLNIFHLCAVLVGVVVIILGVFAYPFVHFIAPGFDTPTTTLTVSLLRVLLPSFLFLFLVDLAVSILNSVKHFLIPALLRVVAPTVSIICIALFVKTIGIYALALGALVGSMAQLALVLWTLGKKGFHYRFVWQPLDPAIKKLVLLVYPFIFSVLVTQVAGIVYRVLVSHLNSGSLSAIKYADKITQLMVIMFLNSINIVIFPIMSEKAGVQDYDGMRSTISDALRLITFITVPLMIGVAVLREPLIALVYQRGSFTVQDAAMTSTALLFLIIGLTTNGISSVFGHATLALQKTKASVAVSITSQVVAISLFILLVPQMALAGLALASSLVPIAIAVMYYIYLTRYIPKLHTVFWHRTYVKIALLAVALIVVLLAITPVTTDLIDNHEAALFLNLIIPTVLGCMVFFGGAYLWRIPEMHEVVSIAHKKVSKKARVVEAEVYEP